MRTYQFPGPAGVDALEVVNRNPPACGADEVRVEMRAWSLNYRDLGVPVRAYGRNDKIVRDPPLVPLSDGAGEVIEVGSDVAEFSVGDRVVSCFFRDWEGDRPGESDLASALGGGLDGTLAEQVVLPERGWVRAPGNLSHEEAACLPCAGLTAWHAVTVGGIRTGETVLTLGTGGVSIFALQFAKAHGARVVITSSSDAKLDRARDLGADHCINYRDTPEWDAEVLERTGGNGVDRVIEVGGMGTLEKSIASVRVGGSISLVGVLTGPEGSFPGMDVILNLITMRGIFVGNRAMFEEMNRAVERNDIHPVIDRTFGFDSLDDVKAAYDHLRSAQHLGKVTITRP